MTPACAPSRALRPMCRCPASPAWPPIMTKSSTTVDPEIPACATTTQQRPNRTLCPICTRLSRREPAPMTVSCVEPRSIVLLAPISTSSSSTTRPTCGTVRKSGRRGGEAEPVLADARAGVQGHARADQGMAHARMGADAAIGTEHHAVADHGRRADAAARADLRPAPMTASGPISADGSTTRFGVHDRARVHARAEAAGQDGRGRRPGPSRHRARALTSARVPAGTRAAMSGCTITAPAWVAASASA